MILNQSRYIYSLASYSARSSKTVFLLNFLLLIAPSLSESTSVGTTAKRTTFLLCLSFKFFFIKIWKICSLSTKGSKCLKIPTDSESRVLSYELVGSSTFLLFLE